MQNSTYFNFLLPEGSDIVNPLVDNNPNWTSLDGLLSQIGERIVASSSHTKTGSVHAVVRGRIANTIGYPIVFRFTATAPWNTGDTMTLNGSAVTVRLPDGTTPGDECFTTGSVVLAGVTGSVVTLYVNNKYLPTASEVTTAGGDSVQDYIDGTIFKNLEAWTPNIGENWETFISRVRDNTTRTQPCNSIRTTVDGISGLIFRQSRRTASNNWIYEAFYTTAAGAVLYTISASPSAAYVRKYNLTSGTVENLSTADAQALQFYGLDV